MNDEERWSMCYEKSRLASFKLWPYKHENDCTAQKMAEAGFFWTGTVTEPDSAQCFVCNKQLHGWEVNDNPWEEHKKHSELCPFVSVNKREADQTVRQFTEMCSCMMENIVNSLNKTMSAEILENVEIKKKIFKDRFEQRYGKKL